MTNIRNMLYGLAGARRIIVTAILSLAVSFYVLGAVSSAAHEQPLASDLNLKFSPQRCGDKIYFFFN